MRIQRCEIDMAQDGCEGDIYNANFGFSFRPVWPVSYCLFIPMEISFALSYCTTNRIATSSVKSLLF